MGAIGAMTVGARRIDTAAGLDDLVVTVPTALAVPRQAETDGQLLDLWLHGRSLHTQRAYRRDVERFLAAVGKPLPVVTLGELQAFATALAAQGLAPGSQRRMLAALKSLLAFGHRLGYLVVNVGAALRLPPVKETLTERRLEAHEVHQLLDREPDRRNRVLLRLTYIAGLRVSEVVSLRWRDLAPRSDGRGQVTVFGKGGKTRVILLPAPVWRDVQTLRPGEVDPDTDKAPVFAGRRGRRTGGPLTTRQAQRLVAAAARRAGLRAGVSPHWLRHAHASHALERGAPVHLVQATLGHASVATTGKYLHAQPEESSATYLA